RRGHAARGGVGQPVPESVYGAVFEFQKRAGRRDLEDQELAPSGTLFAGQHLYGARRLQEVGVDRQNFGQRREGPLRRSEASFGGSLPTAIGDFRQSS